MKIVETTFERLPRERLEIGFEGENLRATVRIDCESVFAEYPNATPALIVKPLFADAYPVVVDRNGTDVDWLITSEILSFSGDGEIQLVFYKDQVICKSAVSKIRVSRSLTVTGDMPDPVVQWIENANRKLAEVDAQIVELEEMVDTATDAAERAEQSASTASTKAEQAAGSAATATAKATEATNAAGTATAKASEAEQSAQTATEKATAAAESERIATAKAVEATTSAGTATTKAEQATEAAQTAIEKAGEASASATAAHASATDAASSATAAQAAQIAANASETAAGASATQAAQSVLDAGANAQTAMQKAAEATQSATNAATSAGTATTKAEEAAASAQAASDAQAAVEQTAEQLADSLEQIDQNTQDIAELDERKANIDGYYPDMTVGNAEQLNSSKYVENSEPYTLRTSGGSSDIGNREYLDAVVGGTVAWNQLVDYDSINSPITVAGITYSMTGNGKISANGTSTGEAAFFLSPDGTNKGNTTYKKDHVYLLKGCPAGGAGTKYYLSWSLSGDDIGSGNVKKATADVGNGYVYIRVRTGVEVSNLVFVPQLFDLTQMFGSAVADYIYNLEQANAGAGVAYFRSWFPNDYYEYNPGELRHVEGLQSHDMVGFNLWDEEWESGSYSSTGQKVTTAAERIRSANKIHVLPSTTYYMTKGVNILCQYDSNGDFISFVQLGVDSASNVGHSVTMGENTHFITFASYAYYGNTYKNDICINLAHNNSRNGEYEPYEKHSYPLDSSVILRGIPKVGSNGVYWDGDRYLPDGTIERRYGVVDMGTLTWLKHSSLGYLYARLDGYAKPTTDASEIYAICSEYTTYSVRDIQYSSTAKGVTLGKSGFFDQNIIVKDTDAGSAESFGAAMSGVLLVYELATPTTETAQPYHSTQWVSDWGTEEFVSTGIVPVGHETRYPANLRDKLQHLPDAASGNGSYLITQTDGQMVLTPFPAPPSTAGNYVLKATVVNGVATYTWEVAT